MGVARPQQCRDQVSLLAIEDEQRMVNVLLVIATVEGALLIPWVGVWVAWKFRSTFCGAPSFSRSLR